MRPIIKSVKHLTNLSRFTVPNGTTTNRVIVESVALASVDASQEVVEGSIIKAVWLELWVTANTAVVGSVVFTIEKVQNKQVAPTFTEMNNLNVYTNKKNILYTFQGLTSPISGGTPFPVHRGWIKIPKGKQRFGLGDELIFNFAPITEGLVVCGMVIFKEYS